jgi:general secretion pathway protein H
MTWRGSSSQRGFTLLEMLIVLVVMGLALGLVLAHGPMRSRTLDTRAAAAGVARMLREARGEAIAENRPVQVVVDLPHHALRIGAGRLRPLPPQLGISVVATAAETLGRTLAAIRFDPDCSATGGHIELIDPGGLRIQVGVDWLTGRVTVVDVPAA